ncbi:MAG TPA: RdgB/HAM1 family non-canonical purine NTP pyrophosphatase [Gemmatimonadaceae bacterium]|nr:RdgB/HAM1 family non-canonical purine NTP pyrophosphatase [Gemmatimonadaceae bacterium]
MTGQPWILATRNAGKLRELRALFADVGLEVVDLAQAGIVERPEEEQIEIHDTFEANALAKARYYAARARGRTVVADDSGLEVLALAGAPGVKSKRWSGRSDLSGAALDASNNALLLERLADGADRRARFVCAAAWCDGARSEVVRGEVPGVIVTEAAGMDGFGYDPHFFATELGMTLGEATVAEKQRVSHRARAFAALLQRLRTRGVVSSAVSASVRTRVAGGS